ncbi:MAG: hypothetical protein LH660_22190 [Phormidesmis sp. CAN_BIN36]|jgi:hypothetical protein|nr:hypothetical protein [Phormidesmis sp. CAN_BIN36]
MQAIEFEAILQNGIVTIPPEYSSQWEGKTVRIIVLDDAKNLAQSVEQPQRPQFKAASLNTKGFKFNREDANDR